MEVSREYAIATRDRLLAEMVDCRYVKDRRVLWRVALEYNQIAKSGANRAVGAAGSSPARHGGLLCVAREG